MSTINHRCRPRVVISMVLAAFVCIATLPCGRTEGTAESSHDQEVLILAAASTREALEQIADALRKRGGPKLTVSPGGSNALAQQIIAGAPADLFLSANTIFADELARHEQVVRTVPLLSGSLVLVVPAGNPASVQGTDDLLKPQVRRVVLAGEHVPAGLYAEQALRKLDLYEPLLRSGRIVRGQNVRFALAYVQRGEVDAGSVYASDAASSTSVRAMFTFDPKDHEPIVYPLVLLERARDRHEVRRAFEFLQSQEAATIFHQHGFHPLTVVADETR
jgi:molybdate transport system substrate-binding protein